MIAIGPETWGPHIWKSIHFVALAYPNDPTEEHKKQYKVFYENIQYVLPCSVCSNNYKKHLEEIPLNDNILKDKETLVKWTIDLHNIVNKQNGKKTLEYEEALSLMLNNFKTEEKIIQVNDKKSKTNIEFKETKPKNKIDINEKDDSSILTSFWFWLVIFMILVSIAVIYKKN